MPFNPVFLYIPNLIGYGRVISCALSCYYAFTDFEKAAVLYLVGQGLDAVDGVAARFFKQTSRFGAVLDMLTDRMGTSALMVVLSHFYPSYWGFFTFLLVLDIVSHWCQMYSKLAMGLVSHKGSTNPLLNFYYNFPYALLVCCCGNEFFFTTLYVLHWTQGPLYSFAGVEMGLFKWIAYINFPIFAFKNLMNLVQLFDAVGEIAALPEPKKQEPKSE